MDLEVNVAAAESSDKATPKQMLTNVQNRRTVRLFIVTPHHCFISMQWMCLKTKQLRLALKSFEPNKLFKHWTPGRKILSEQFIYHQENKLFTDT